MKPPKIRMVAGPNGSGKTTLIEYFRAHYSFPLGFCQNPDKLEEELFREQKLDFTTWGLEVRQAGFGRFIRSHPLFDSSWTRQAAVENNVLKIAPNLRKGYFTAVLCDFMRRQWLAAGVTFTFETVMSSADKVRLLRRAQGRGFRTYLYFICTTSAAINFERVAVRVADGGHGVAKEKIEQRYFRSLALLERAIEASNRAYLFDNSGQAHRLVGEFEDGKLQSAAKDLPAWFQKSD